MNLLLINGSPRGQQSNTKILFGNFVEGVKSVNILVKIELSYLNHPKNIDEVIEKFSKADYVIIGFPLYADAMPGIVMHCIEHIPESKQKMVGFLVQSGFQEAIHSIYIERYLEKLSKRMDWNYMGTIIKGGVEGIQIMPNWMTSKLFKQFYMLGVHFGKFQQFDTDIIKRLRTPLKMSKSRLRIAKLMSKTGMMNFYWNKKLKEHNAFENRFDAPYWSS